MKTGTRAPWLPDDLDLLPDILFTNDNQPGLKLDLFRLRDVRIDGPLPLVLWLHGGGWRSGDKTRGVERIFDLVRAGFAGASADYRLSDQALFPAQLYDCKCTVRYLRSHASQYNIDPNRIGVWGASAGGHLASLLAVTGDRSELEGTRGWPNASSAIQAACSWYGPSDLNLMDRFPLGITPRLPSMTADSAEGRLVGGAIKERQDLVSLANPIRYIHSKTPPILLMHGAHDDYVPMASSEAFYDALNAHNAPAELHIIEDGYHNAEGWTSQHLQIATKFFERHLGSHSSR